MGIRTAFRRKLSRPARRCACLLLAQAPFLAFALTFSGLAHGRPALGRVWVAHGLASTNPFCNLERTLTVMARLDNAQFFKQGRPNQDQRRGGGGK